MLFTLILNDGRYSTNIFMRWYEEEYYCILTSARNLVKRVSIENNKLELAEEIMIILGKYQDPGHNEILNDPNVLKLILESKDVLIPSYYYQYNKPEDGYDVALIGLSKYNKTKLDLYFKYNYDRCL